MTLEAIKSIRRSWKIVIFFTLFYVSTVTKCKSKQSQTDVLVENMIK